MYVYRGLHCADSVTHRGPCLHFVRACTPTGKRRYNIKLWKTFTDCFNCLPIAAIIDEKIFTMHGGLSPDLQSMEQIRRVMRPTDVPDTGASLSLPGALFPNWPYWEAMQFMLMHFHAPRVVVRSPMV